MIGSQTIWHWISQIIYPNIPSGGGYYNINNVQGLKDLLGFSDNGEYRFRLTADLDLSAYPGLYIPFFCGEFDGSNHTISNSYILFQISTLGMFGYVYGGKITNIELKDIDLTGISRIGGLVGYNFYGTLSNCHVKGEVNGEFDIGVL